MHALVYWIVYCKDKTFYIIASMEKSLKTIIMEQFRYDPQLLHVLLHVFLPQHDSLSAACCVVFSGLEKRKRVCQPMFDKLNSHIHVCVFLDLRT